jgi:class 3 adenylate cyclase
LEKVASPGTMVVTQEAAATLSAEDWVVEDLGAEFLRGVEHPVRVLAVSPATR